MRRLRKHLTWHRRLLAAGSLLLILAGLFGGQPKPQPDLYGPVPEALRSRLRERMNSLVENYRTGRWDKLYDLLTDDFNVGTREEFVKSRKEDPRLTDSLLDFTPRQIFFEEGSSEWEISGCGKWKNRGELATAIFAYRRHDDWYFSPLALYVQTKGSGSSISMNINDTTPCHTSAVSSVYAFQ